ncbi:MAG: FkbM family methyltransferase [Cetobacterium sp.]|uniref:FkbM family methyltransferase n=1 Tax=Cetobacterium sp. TaxID=2071632 RepID=UPI003F356415
MTEKDFLDELTRRKEEYLKKSRSFNDKKTILLIGENERDFMIDWGRENKIFFNEIYEVKENSEILDIVEKYRNEVNYFFTNKVINDDIYNRIREIEIKLENIYVGPTKNSYVDLYEKRDNIYRNRDKIAQVFNYLEDEKSKNVYWNVLVRLCLPYQYHYFYEVEDFNQYFPREFNFGKDEVYLDGGVYDGKNIYEFMEKVNHKYKYIYGIEPDPNNYKKSKVNLEGIENLELYEKALHGENEVVSFLSTNNSSKRGNAHVVPEGDITVEGIKGDHLKNKPTFIKMDIEGSEKDALDGLKHTIMEGKPKLAICIYHFQEDFWEIPLKIKEFNPNYKLIIRNHEKMFCLIETVCYGYEN